MAKILVVDDEGKIRDMFKSFFTKKGFDVIQASGGDEAISLLKIDEKIDLMVLDLRMPQTNGLDVLRRKKELKDSRPVIVLTGITQVNFFVNLKEFGVESEDVLYKPFELDNILSLVKKKLNIDA